jgi:hypothetical protein
MQARNIIISFVTFLLFLNSCNQKTEQGEYDNLWISTSREMWSGEAGILMDLSRKDSLFITNYFDSENLKGSKYNIDLSKNLILNDTTNFGRIIKRNKNILLIETTFDTISFIPIKNYSLNIDTAELKQALLENDWQLYDVFGLLRLEFFKSPWFSNSSRLKTYYRINEETGCEMFEAEWWTIEKYKNAYFIIISHYHSNYQIYQIKNFTDSVIITETCWRDSVIEANFSITKPLTESAYREKSNLIIGSWNLIDYEETVDSLGLFEEEIIPITMTNRMRPFAEEDSIPMILDKYYVEKSINYEFLSSGKCQMKSGDEVLRTADWKLSKDGKYIQFKNGLMHNMKIDFLADSLLKIGKHETIEFLDSFYWKRKYYIETLKK